MSKPKTTKPKQPLNQPFLYLVQTHDGSVKCKWRTKHTARKGEFEKAHKHFHRLHDKRSTGGIRIVTTEGNVEAQVIMSGNAFAFKRNKLPSAAVRA